MKKISNKIKGCLLSNEEIYYCMVNNVHKLGGNTEW